jgi:hypothetical protein
MTSFIHNLNLYLCDHFCRCRGRVVFRLGLVADVAAQSPKAHQFRRPVPSEPDLEVAMLTEQQFTVSVKYTDSKGKAAKVDGTPTWATDNSDILTLTPAADGLSCLVVSGIVPGSAKVLNSADADLGAGVALITGTLDVSVSARPATNVTLTGDSPVDVP